MVVTSLSIFNPFTKNCNFKSKDFFVKTWKVSKNKFLEIQASNFGTSVLFNLRLDLAWKGQDHTGLSFDIGVLGYYFEISLYDHRHWDYGKGAWETATEN